MKVKADGKKQKPAVWCMKHIERIILRLCEMIEEPISGDNGTAAIDNNDVACLSVLIEVMEEDRDTLADNLSERLNTYHGIIRKFAEKIMVSKKKFADKVLRNQAEKHVSELAQMFAKIKDEFGLHEKEEGDSGNAVDPIKLLGECIFFLGTIGRLAGKIEENDEAPDVLEGTAVALSYLTGILIKAWMEGRPINGGLNDLIQTADAFKNLYGKNLMYDGISFYDAVESLPAIQSSIKSLLNLLKDMNEASYESVVRNLRYLRHRGGNATIVIAGDIKFDGNGEDPGSLESVFEHINERLGGMEEKIGSTLKSVEERLGALESGAKAHICGGACHNIEEH